METFSGVRRIAGFVLVSPVYPVVFIGSLVPCLCLRETLLFEVLPQQQPGTLGEKNATQLLSKEAQNSEDLCCPTAQSSQGTSATSNTQVKTSV